MQVGGHSQPKLVRSRRTLQKASGEAHTDHSNLKPKSGSFAYELDSHVQQKLVRRPASAKSRSNVELHQRSAQVEEVNVTDDARRASADVEEIDLQQAFSAKSLIGLARLRVKHLLDWISLDGMVTVLIFLFLAKACFHCFAAGAFAYYRNRSDQYSQESPFLTTMSIEPRARMKMDLVIQVKNARNLPVSREIVAPYVEISCVKADPKGRQSGQVHAPIAIKRTHSKQDEADPEWNETLTLSKIVYEPEHFIKIALWDSNETSQNTPIGYHSVGLSEFVSGLMCNPNEDGIASKSYTADNLVSLLPDTSEVLQSVVNLTISCVPICKFVVSVLKASLLPAGAQGDLASFVEIRVVHGDPHGQEYHTKPHHETVWHGRSRTVHGSTDPEYNDEINFMVAASPECYILLCVIDSANLSDDDDKLSHTPVGMTAVPVKEVLKYSEGQAATYDRSLEKLPNWSSADNLDCAKLLFNISHKLAVAA
jgi:hypothetical protein